MSISKKLLLFASLPLNCFALVPMSLTSLYNPKSHQKSTNNNNESNGLIQSKLLIAASEFLYYRYLGYDQIGDLFHSNVNAYNIDGGKIAITNFIVNNQFNFPVSSIKADVSMNSVLVEYEEGLDIAMEKIYFENNEITYIQSLYNTNSFPTFNPRIQVCGGADSNITIRALKSVRILKLATKFLSYDITRDLVNQNNYLTETSKAFGAIGNIEIMEIQKQGVESGTYYSLPFPILVNIENESVSLDFYAHKKGEETKQRGTDIMYLDIIDNKILKIDTVRHALVQPDWVVKHFNNNDNK